MPFFIFYYRSAASEPLCRFEPYPRAEYIYIAKFVDGEKQPVRFQYTNYYYRVQFAPRRFRPTRNTSSSIPWG